MITKKSRYTKKSRHTKKSRTINKTKKLKNNEKALSLLIEFINQHIESFKKGIIFKNETLDNIIFNRASSSQCICENIFKEHLDNTCSCNNMKTYTSQGKSGAEIHAIKCNNNNTILKINKIKYYYMKMRDMTKKYMFCEFDRTTLQTVINTYVYNELPYNTVELINSGICRKREHKKILETDGIKHGINHTSNDKFSGDYYSYNLMSEADLGDGEKFLIKLIDDKYNAIFSIPNSLKDSITVEEYKYKLVMSFFLQTICIIGHLQSSYLNFFHGDFKPDNVFVKLCDTKKTNYFYFTIYGKKIKVKNMGFAVLIADFDLASITINHNTNNLENKQIRLIPPIEFKPLIGNYVTTMIKEYADIEPTKIEDYGYLKVSILKNIFLSKITPRIVDPILSILRASGLTLYKDLDLYIFFIKLFNISKVRNYIVSNKIDIETPILNFMSEKFKTMMLKTLSKPDKFISMNETTYIIIDTYDKIKEPMNPIFTNDYINNLNKFSKL